ncbi:MAG: hypothetical protein HXY18_02395 [Bryobacteraceae bacterium]|nr:hypothetical protein [Bryobacteraceae bacterium]
MQKFLFASAVMMLAGCYACRERYLSDQVFYAPADDDSGGQTWCRFSAPIIVVATILEVRFSGTASVAGAYGTPLVRIDLRLETEEVLWGQLRDKSAHVKGFVMRHPAPMSRKGNLKAPLFSHGQRRIFFLRRLGDEIRLARDCYDYSIPLHTGRHLPVTTGSLPARERAVYLMTVPGDGADLEEWLPRFGKYLNEGMLLIGPKAVEALLIAHERAVRQLPGGEKAWKDFQSFRMYVPRLDSTYARESDPAGCLDFGQ